MTNLEIILTVGVWVSVAIVFCYYRSLGAKPQREQNPEGRHPKASPHGGVSP
jgi:hypothetical protein